MSTYTGYKVEQAIEVAQDAVTSANLLIARDYYTGDVLPAADEPHVSFSPVYAYASPAPFSATTAGYKAHDFGDDWYDRIHIIPAQVQLGTVTSDRDAPITVWNAYLTPKDITAVDSDIGTGITVEAPAGFALPYSMLGLSTAVFTLKVSTVGPSQIDTAFRVTVDGQEVSVPVTGVRSAAFYFALNWGQGALEESFEANSWVFRAASGVEQSGSVSGSKAVKRELTYPVLLSKRHAQAFLNMTFAWQERAFGVPHRPESTHLTAPAAAGDMAISCDTTERSFSVGGSVFLYEGNDKWESRTILAVTPTGLEFTTPLAYDWPEDARACPLLPGFIADKVSTTWLTSGVMRALVTFTIDPSGAPSNLVETLPPYTYNGVELYMGPVNWKNEMPLEVESSAIRMDKKVGRIRQRPVAGYGTITREHNWLIRNRQEAAALRQFVARRRGVARRVYMPSGLDDFTLVGSELSASSTLDVQRNVFAELIGSHPARRTILILFRDGSYLIRTVLSATDLEDGATTRLNLSEAHGRDIPMHEVKRISFLHLYRFASNRFSIRWMTDEKAVAEADMTVLREEI